jgi:phosphomannomutase
MFDGDVDRIGLVTNTGVIMPGDMVAAMIAKKTIEESQEKEPTILYEVMSSKTIPETVEKL